MIVTMLITALAWILAAWGAAEIGRSHGRDFSTWFLGALLFTPLAMLVLLLKRPTREEAERAALYAGNVKRCPECAELVKAEATRCRYCHQPIARGALVAASGVTAAPSPWTMRISPVAVVVLVAAAAISIYVFGVLGL